MSLFKVTLLTIFPEMYPGPLGLSLAGKAMSSGVWQLNVVNIRDFAGKNGRVDDSPLGGGTGMVMRPDVLGDAIDYAIKISGTHNILYPSPRGESFDQKKAREIVELNNIIILCGRYEGIDERIIDAYNAREISVGDFVLSGGEVASMVMMDACVRLLPGVIDKSSALLEESFGSDSEYSGLLEYPLYTRPSIWRGVEAPPVLLSGDHAAISRWKLEQARCVTQNRRKDLWKKYLNL